MNVSVLIIAHRGGAGLAPENTLSCFSEGIKYADMIELDVQPSSDQCPVIFHDRNNIERTTNGKGKISNLTLKYLKSLDAGSWFDPHFHNERIPTLSEVFSTLSSKNRYNLELKFFDPHSDWFERLIIDILYQFKLQKQVIIAARHEENIVRIQKCDTTIKCVLLQKERDNKEYFDILMKLQLSFAQIRKRALNENFIQQCHDQGIKVFYFYADEIDEMQHAISTGIDGILTNYPNIMKTFLNNLE
ncbi:MAG: glycerophosphodiester phosphodiesterase [Candidatus Hodarchaeales archaeon]